jgi:hypothetical protein
VLRLAGQLAAGDGPTRVVTERAEDGSLKAYAIGDDGALVELEPVRRAVGSLLFAWPGESGAAAALPDDELLATAEPTTILQHLGWPGAWASLGGGAYAAERAGATED